MITESKRCPELFHVVTPPPASGTENGTGTGTEMGTETGMGTENQKWVGLSCSTAL